MSPPAKPGDRRHRFRFAAPYLLPRWLTTGEGDPLTFSLGAFCDVALRRMKAGAQARFPEHCASDALAALARDRKIQRGIDEPAADFAARLKPWLTDHRRRGNPFGMGQQLRSYCKGARVRTVDPRGNWFTVAADGTESYAFKAANWDWDGSAPAPNWGKFWTIIYAPLDGSLWNQDKVWGGAGVRWGVVDGDETWGSSMTRGQLQTLRAIIRDWKPAGTMCQWIIVVFDWGVVDPFDPTGAGPPLPGGDWGAWGKSVGGVRVPARDTRAIYCEGS